VNHDAAADDTADITADRPEDPFADTDRALDALCMAWGDEYDEIWFHGGTGWGAHHKDAPDDDEITAPAPAELNRKIRADWHQRQGHQQ